MDILIKNIDMIPCDQDNHVVKNATLGIQDGKIQFIRAGQESIDDFKASRVIDGKNKMLLPGLVNAHTHSPMTILRNYADDLALEEWLFQNIIPAEGKLSPEDVYWGAMLGITEMIKSGTTCFADMYLHVEQVAQAVLDSGIRVNISKGPLVSGVRGHEGILVDVEGASEYYKTWHNRDHGRIKVYVEIHSVYLFDEESITGAAKLAKDLGTGIHIHVSETMAELKTSQEKYQRSPVEVCSECGIFDVPVLAAHGVHLSDSDVKILKEKKVNIVHNPTSNLKLGSGIARIPFLLEQGINIALGTDGTASNNNLNMFEEMHLAALIHKGIHQDPTLVNASQVLKMATANGARAAGFENEVGSIKEGMKADLILLNTDQAHLSPLNDPISAVVYAAQASDVDTVIVDGKILMENRKLTTIDEEMVKYKVREIAQRITK